MKKLFVAIAALFMFASCSKDKDQAGTAPTGTTKKLVKADYIETDGSTESHTMSYDPQGRLSKVTEPDTRFEFDYQSPTFLKVTSFNTTTGAIYRTYECDINEKGYITQMVYKNSAGTMIYRYQYTYNADGYMVVIKGSPDMTDDYEEQYTIVNGNTVSSKVYYEGVLYHNREYTFDTKPTKGVYGYRGQWPASKMFGKPQANHLVEFRDFDSAGTLGWYTKSSHEFDADGYVRKQTTQYVLQAETDYSIFTYE